MIIISPVQNGLSVSHVSCEVLPSLVLLCFRYCLCVEYGKIPLTFTISHVSPLHTSLLFHLLSSDLALPQRYPSTASLKTRWTNSGLENATDTSKFKLVVWERLENTPVSDDLPICVGAGFFCNNTCNRSLFAVLLIFVDDENKTSDVVVAWSANRNRLVGENATLELKADGDLVLKDSDGSLVWSTSTSHKGVLGMTIRSSGNLVLFNSSNQTVWQSFDHPTDTLMVDQRLSPGQKLVANDSPENTSEGVFSLSIIPGGFAMFASAQMFYRHILLNETALCYLQLVLQGLSVLYYPAGEPAYTFQWSEANTSIYIKLEPDGHLQYYRRGKKFLWKSRVTNLLFDDLQFCDYPGACKGYSICTSGQCTCPIGADASNSFIPADKRQPRHGCFPPTPLAGCATTNGSAGQHFLELEQVSYFNHIIDNHSLISNSTTMDECKNICYNRCSCESAFFVYNGTNNSHGSCFLPSKVFSLLQNNPNSTSYNSYAFLKVQNISTATPNRSTATPSKSHFPRAIIAVISAAVGVGAAGYALAFLWLHRRKTSMKETLEDDEDFDYETVPGLPVRFSYDELRSATQEFSTKLSGGGFGSVFAGILPNGTQIAVKRLEYGKRGQGMKEFRAEVQTIGGINHFNLVKLQGFCAEKSHRLLVYEYLENGSLDKWLFSKNSERTLDWNTRLKIALDSAQGLAYLHGDCRECIIHLDIKPQNILLDDKFNAKISDFGLSRLMQK